MHGVSKYTFLDNASGRNLRRRRRPASKLTPAAARAIVAAGLTTRGFSVRWASDLAGASMSYVNKVRHMSDVDRFRLLRGEVSLSHLCNGHRHRREPSDEQVNRFITRAGPGRVMNALDRLTAPASVAAE